MMKIILAYKEVRGDLMILRYIKSGRVSAVYKTMLVIIDIICINCCSIFALLFRDTLGVGGVNNDQWQNITRVMVVNTIMTITIFYFCRLYHSLWKFAGLKEVFYVILACGVSVTAHMACFFFTGTLTPKLVPTSYPVIYGMSLLFLTFGSRFTYRFLRMVHRGSQHGESTRKTMIIGAGDACNIVMNELTMSRYLDSKIMCIIDDNKSKHNTFIHGVKVVGGRDRIIEMVEKYGINEIIIAMPSISRKKLKDILKICQQTDAELKIVPGVYQLVNGDVTVDKMRKVQIEDLLGRDPVNVNLEGAMNYVSGKTVLVTGGGGSIGSELCRQIAANIPKRLIIFDIYENSAYDIQQELRHEFPELDLVVLIGSVRNTDRINSVFEKYRPQIVYHAAAHKHVPLMEDSPNEAIKNNVFGTYKTAVAADLYDTEKFVLISTDKAVNPTNIMGASKRLCEMIVQAFNIQSKTDYVAVRFGNVLGSNGSVIPLFRKQIEAGGPITVTHPDIIRYFMTIPEAVSLVIQAGAFAKGGEIFVLDMGEPIKIVDLAKNLIRLSGFVLGQDISIKYIGLRPGEKLYEEMLMDEEGLTDTENKMIHIGMPIDIDEDKFFRQLDQLYEYAYEESDKIKDLVKEMVPTYQIREADIERDRELREGQFKSFEDLEKKPKRLMRRS